MSATGPRRYVYFAKPVGMDGPIKIGCTNCPEQRLHSLMTWSPWPLEIAVTIPGGGSLERNIQECLIAHRSHQEWFHAHPPVTELIAALKRGVPIAEALDLSKRAGSMRPRLVRAA